MKREFIKRNAGIDIAKDDFKVNFFRVDVGFERSGQRVKNFARSGIYFLRTSLPYTETILWQGYNTIREIKAAFRCLKTDLDLRPICHKNDDGTTAHLHLGLLAYRVVNTVRHQLKNLLLFISVQRLQLI